MLQLVHLYTPIQCIYQVYNLHSNFHNQNKKFRIDKDLDYILYTDILHLNMFCLLRIFDIHLNNNNYLVECHNNKENRLHNIHQTECILGNQKDNN